MKRKTLENSLFYPIALLSLISLVVFGLISYSSIKISVNEVLTQQLKTNVSLFSESIRESLLTGLENEVFRKCNDFIKAPYTERLVVQTSDGRKICDLGSSTRGFKVIKSIYFDSTETKKVATVETYMKDTVSSAFLKRTSTILLAVLCFLLITYILIGKYVVRSSAKSITDLSEILQNDDISSLKNISKSLSKSSIEEVKLLYKGVEDQARKVDLYNKKIVQLEKVKIANEMAASLAHDIKSPLSGIEAVAHDVDTDRETQNLLKTSLNRIHQLIQELISIDKESTDLKLSKNEKTLVNEVLREHIKNLNVTYRTNINFDSVCPESTCLEVPKSLFLRSISNLVKNAYESIEIKELGKIDILVSESPESIHISVADNGCGIPTDRIEKLGEKGVTYRQNGSGYGLFQVKDMIIKSHGQLQISSNVGAGTRITLMFPKKVDSIFLEGVQIGDSSKLLVLDDEIIVKDTWRLLLDKKGISNDLIYFSNSDSLIKWVTENEDLLSNSIALFDYDIKEPMTGLDLLTKFAFSIKILVTGDASQVSVQKECYQSNVGLISKSDLHNLNIIAL